MSKKEELLFDHDGQISIEDMQDERGPCEVPYSAPPNENAKWKALVAIGAMPKWNGTMKGVMTCLIQCSNYYSGKTCPSEEWMAERLDCTDRAVRKAICTLEKRFPKFLQVHHRSEPGRSAWKANGYVIGWKALINRCHAAFPWTDVTLASPRRHAADRRNERSGTEEQSFLARGNERSCELIEEKLIEGTYRHKVVHPPSAADTIDSFLNEKRGHPVGASLEASISNECTAKPTAFNNLKWWKLQLTRAEEALKEETDPKRRSVVEEEVDRRRRRIEELENEQRAKANTGSR